MKNILSFAALSGMMCVLFGAFGAHALKPHLSRDVLSIYETAVRYQFFHTLALILVSVLYHTHQNKWVMRSAKLFVLGIVLFSGSLYAMALSGLDGDPNRWFGVITPMGGTALIMGWLVLFIGVRKQSSKEI